MRVAGVVIGFIGLALVIWKGSPWLAVGVLLMLWGNNLERRAEVSGLDRAARDFLKTLRGA